MRKFPQSCPDLGAPQKEWDAYAKEEKRLSEQSRKFKELEKEWEFLPPTFQALILATCRTKAREARQQKVGHHFG
jgi:hypothetical protein